MNENNLLLILSVLFSRARPKIWWIYIYQIWSADWKTLFGRSKNYFEATFSNSKASFNKKPNSSTPQWTVAKMTYIWFWVHWLAERTPKSGQYKFTNSCRLTGGDTKEGAKIVLKLLILTWRPVLGKKVGGLSNREKLRESLIFDSGRTGWQSTPQNLANISLLNINLPIWSADSKRP